MLDVGLAWRGLDWPLLVGGVAAWKGLDLAARAALKHHSGDKVRRLGFSYATSVLNATVAVALGGAGLALLWHAPPEARAFIPVDPSDPWFAAASICARAGYIFSSWVAMDAVHVVAHFPHLGGADAVAHHGVFLLLTLLSVGFGICPFAGAWLLCGELSTLPLNARFFLANSGMGASSAMAAANAAFAVTFFTGRVAVYWVGLHGFVTETVPELLARGATPTFAYAYASLLVFGAILNAYWFVLILKMALKPLKKGTKPKKIN